MKSRVRDSFDSKGITMVELIIVIAIMAILTGALAPAIIKYLEKSRRVKDVQNATDIESVLVHAFASGDIELPAGMRKQGYGLWVMMCRGSKANAPVPYHGKNLGTVWCGADKGVSFDGVVSDNDWSYCQALDDFLRKEGIDLDSVKTLSNGSEGGWDWIIIQICYDKNGRLCSRIYSGFKNQDGGINKTPVTNIEKRIGRGWIDIE